MIVWALLGGLVALALALALSLPSFVRAGALVRCGPSFEAHGAVNDPRFR